MRVDHEFDRQRRESMDLSEQLPRGGWISECVNDCNAVLADHKSGVCQRLAVGRGNCCVDVIPQWLERIGRFGGSVGCLCAARAGKKNGDQKSKHPHRESHVVSLPGTER